MHWLSYFAPIFVFFEVWQLFIAERYLGIKQIARGVDPRTLGLSEATAFLWVAAIGAYWLWLLLLLTTSIGRVHAVALLLVSMAGYVARRGAPLKWVLVILTLEGAIRLGLLVSLCGLAWRSR